jgi:hypothetical protein
MAEILAHKTCTAKFTIPDSTRPEMEKAITERLRLGEDIIWEDDPEGINVDVISRNKAFKIRKRFSKNGDDTQQLLIENKSSEAPPELVDSAQGDGGDNE